MGQGGGAAEGRAPAVMATKRSTLTQPLPSCSSLSHNLFLCFHLKLRLNNQELPGRGLNETVQVGKALGVQTEGHVVSLSLITGLQDEDGTLAPPASQLDT